MLQRREVRQFIAGARLDADHSLSPAGLRRANRRPPEPARPNARRGMLGLPLLAVAAVALGACSFAGTMAEHAFNYNETVEDSANEAILLNVLRARDRKPMHFTALSQIRGDFTLSGTAGSSANAPVGGSAPDTYTLIPSISATISGRPSFDLDILNKQKFMQGITKPIQMKLFHYYWEQGWPRQMLLHLFIRKVVQTESLILEEFTAATPEDGGKERIVTKRGILSTSKTYYNSPDIPDPTVFKEFQDWVDDVRYDMPRKERLRLGTSFTSQPIGPMLEVMNEASLEHLIDADAAGLTVNAGVTATGKAGFQLCRIEKRSSFCFGECPKDTDCKEKPGPGKFSTADIVAGGYEDIDEFVKETCKKIAAGLSDATVKYTQSEETKQIGQKRDPDSAVQSLQGSVKVSQSEKYVGGKLTQRCTSGGKTIDAHLRSVEAMLYYLGEVVRADEKGIKVHIKVGPRKEEQPLFILSTADDLPHGTEIAVDYEGDTYRVPRNPAGEISVKGQGGGGRTMHVLSLLTQLFALNQTAEELPGTGVVRSVGQ